MKIKNYPLIAFLGSIASIIGLLLYFMPLIKASPLQLTVLVSDNKGRVILENKGELVVDFGNDRRRALIGEAGRTNFGEIPTKFINTTIRLGFDVDGYQIEDGIDTFIFDGDPIHLVINYNEKFGRVKGVVKDLEGKTFIDSAQVRINNDTIVYSDTNGIFNVLLPEDMRIKKMDGQYNLTVIKKGYESSTELYSPFSTDAEIRLKSNN